MVENHQAARFHPPVRYQVGFPAPETHYLQVEAMLPTDGRSEIEVFLPVWTPGSYLVREYARHIEGMAARDEWNRPLPCEKSRKNRWRVATGGAAQIHLSYQVYCREMSVRTNWVEDTFALVNGAPTFVTLPECLSRPHEIGFVLPESWKSTVTGLPPVPGGAPHSYLAADYDTLVDSPV